MGGVDDAPFKRGSPFKVPLKSVSAKCQLIAVKLESESSVIKSNNFSREADKSDFFMANTPIFNCAY